MKQWMIWQDKAKWIKGILSALWWAVIVLTVGLLVCVLSAKFRGEVPKIFGHSVLLITTGSMEPSIPTGSYILVKDCAPEDVKQGDIICFYSEDVAIYGRPNTHRVVEPPIEGIEGLEFVTQGDANGAADSVRAKEARLIGVYVGQLDWLTRFSTALNGRGMFVLFMVLQVGIVAVFCGSLLRKKPAADEEEPTT